MSKLLLLVFLAVAFIASCASEEKIDYVEPDVKEQLLEVGKQENLITPQGARTSVKLMYEMRLDKSMKSMIMIMQPELMKVAMMSNEDFDHELATFYQEIILEEFDELAPGLIREFGALYEKYYSEEELQILLEFYQSSIGRKMLDTESVLMGEAVEIGQRLDKKLQQRIVARTHEFKRAEGKANE